MDQLCLKWNNYHSSMTYVINQLLNENVFVDVTLSCENTEIKAHKLILSACSTYFQRVLVNNITGHPVLIMPPGVKAMDLKAIVEYIYKGEIYVTREQLSDIVQVANLLKIKGLSESSEEIIPSPVPGASTEPTAQGDTNNQGLQPLDMSGASVSQARKLSISSRQDSNSSQKDVTPETESNLDINGIKRARHSSGEERTPEAALDFRNSSLGSKNKKLKRPYLKKRSTGNPPWRKEQEDEDNTSESGHAFGKESPSSSSMYLDKPVGATDSPNQVGSTGNGSNNPIDFYNIKTEAGIEENTTKFGDIEEHSNEAKPIEITEARARRKIHDLFDVNKRYSKQDLESALDSIRQGIMTISTACTTFGIPAATLWQRAHKMGIISSQTSTNRLWNEEDMQQALDALRTGRISANRASKEYGVPSSTLYKMAKKEGIKLAMPFGSGPVSYSQENLNFALDAIRNGLSVQKASNQFGIPPGTLYAKCKKEGIELSHKAFPSGKPWTHESMLVALDAVLMGHLSINQASNKYNVPYSSLYSRVKRIQAGEELDIEQDEELYDDEYDEQLTLDASMNDSTNDPVLQS
ncbi:uncharacterized protein LOC136040785 [Artemia franciscana]|uniref:Pipsqueak n=1 Tax=Artemia franciscana TaxID=6661 RepID=A0AA88HT61_ARTSF|nr:hypothetical protein QYM36_009477 [Artemia franciscana]